MAKIFFLPTQRGQKEYAYLYRGRMDVRIDLVRALRGKRFKYIRNYMPQRPNGQHLEYLWKAASVRSWQQKCQQGQCNKTQQRFWQARPAEELYDTRADKWEVNNLADSPLYKRHTAEDARSIKDVRIGAIKMWGLYRRGNWLHEPRPSPAMNW